VREFAVLFELLGIPGFIVQEILGGSFVFSSNPLTARPSNTFLKINTINVVVNSIRWLK
jgi:hypothetical protein